MNLDPATVNPMPGKVLIHVVEVLGGMTRGGIFVPGSTQNHSGKDTVYGRVMKLGPPGTVIKKGRDGDASFVEGSRPWPEGYRKIAVGDIVVAPRDVPLAFTFGDDRYAMLFEHEAIVTIPGDEFDASGFEVVPWRASEKLAGEVGS